MTFYSYAQNFEDVILQRVFSDVAKGFYIDVGAQHPQTDSVTHAFYKAGWRGVNIEPVPHYFNLLKKQRPHDINLPLLAGDHQGSETFYEMINSGLSTIDPELARRAVARGITLKGENTVPVTTLDQICEDHSISKVHFLKIDVEGAELAVLKGMAFDKVRPTVLVIEATEPNTQIFNHDKWEPYVAAHGYGYVYCDGLNRFYLAQEHGALEEKFKFPPNSFDNFRKHVPASTLFSEAQRLLLQSKAVRPVYQGLRTIKRALVPSGRS